MFCEMGKASVSSIFVLSSSNESMNSTAFLNSGDKVLGVVGMFRMKNRGKAGEYQRYIRTFILITQ